MKNGREITAQIKLYLHKPLDTEWKEAGQILDDLSYECVKGLNYAITHYYLYEQASYRHFKKTGKSLSREGRNAFEKHIYKRLGEIMENASRAIVAWTQRLAKTKWRNSKTEVTRLHQSLPSYKLGHPVSCRAAELKLRRDNGNYIFTCSLRKQGLEPSRLAFLLDTFKLEKARKAVLDRIIDGIYTLGACQIGKDKIKNSSGRTKRFVRIAYKFEEASTQLDKNICVGVDLGLASPFYCAVNNGHDRLPCNEALLIEKFRWQIRRRRRSYQNSLKFSNRGGHGRKKSLKPLDKLAEKEGLFRDAKYHAYTRQIIDFARKHRAGLIQIESLQGFRSSQQGILKDWAIADFHGKLKYKAEQAGIVVREINAQYTSQRCSECGHIDDGNRPQQAVFECLRCGHKDHADYNAAKNIANPEIEGVIKRDIKSQGLKDHESEEEK